jgi:hypothetical protein
MRRSISGLIPTRSGVNNCEGGVWGWVAARRFQEVGRRTFPQLFGLLGVQPANALHCAGPPSHLCGSSCGRFRLARIKCGLQRKKTHRQRHKVLHVYPKGSYCGGNCSSVGIPRAGRSTHSSCVRRRITMEVCPPHERSRAHARRSTSHPCVGAHPCVSLPSPVTVYRCSSSIQGCATAACRVPAPPTEEEPSPLRDPPLLGEVAARHGGRGQTRHRAPHVVHHLADE